MLDHSPKRRADLALWRASLASEANLPPAFVWVSWVTYGRPPAYDSPMHPPDPSTERRREDCKPSARAAATSSAWRRGSMTQVLGGVRDLRRPAIPPEREAGRQEEVSEGRQALPRSMIALTMEWLSVPG